MNVRVPQAKAARSDSRRDHVDAASTGATSAAGETDDDDLPPLTDSSGDDTARKGRRLKTETDSESEEENDGEAEVRHVLEVENAWPTYLERMAAALDDCESVEDNDTSGEEQASGTCLATSFRRRRISTKRPCAADGSYGQASAAPTVRPQASGSSGVEASSTMEVRRRIEDKRPAPI